MVQALREHHSVTEYDIATHHAHPDVSGHNWIVHLGAETSTTQTNVELVLERNLDYSVWLLDQAIDHQVHFQWASSASVYGPDCEDFSETAPVNPRSPYAWSKYLFERHASTKHNQGIHIQGFRYFNVHGPHEDHKGTQASPHHQFACQAREQQQITVFEGSEHYRRDFVPVSDVVQTHQRFFAVNHSGVWNVGTGRTMSFADIAAQFGVPVITVPMPAQLQTSYQKYTCADMSKTHSTLSQL